MWPRLCAENAGVQAVQREGKAMIPTPPTDDDKHLPESLRVTWAYVRLDLIATLNRMLAREIGLAKKAQE
jgi:hypothetical protein